MLKKTFISFLVLVSFLQTPLFADYITGEIVYLNALKKTCGFKGDVMAKKYTQDEWKSFYEKGQLNKAIQDICPEAEIIPKKYLDDLFEFFYKFAKDVPEEPVC